jgi:hypothetical protein
LSNEEKEEVWLTHFVYLIRGRKVGATRDRLRDRLREQGHDLPHRVTDDGQVLPGDPDVEVLAVYTAVRIVEVSNP